MSTKTITEQSTSATVGGVIDTTTDVFSMNDFTIGAVSTEMRAIGVSLEADLVGTEAVIQIAQLIPTLLVGPIADAHVGPHIDIHAGLHSDFRVGLHNDVHVGAHNSTHVGAHIDGHVGQHFEVHLAPHVTIDTQAKKIETMTMRQYMDMIVNNAGDKVVNHTEVSTFFAGSIHISPLHISA